MKLLLPLLLLPASGFAALVEKDVEYNHGGATLEGFHVYDDAVVGRRPGILVVHQWTGLTDYEKGRARQLAAMGYNVFAADIYGKGIRPRPPEAGQVAGKYKGNRELYRGRLAAGLGILREDSRTDPSRMAAIGYCFGGTGVLELARSGADIAGVVSFHGGLGAADDMAAAPGSVKARILVCHGAEDPFVPKEEIDGFVTEMRDARADFQFIAYAHAVHAFTQKMAGSDPSKGAAFHGMADRRSWEHMKLFFRELFD